MSNRLDHEFPQSRWQAVPPIGPDGHQIYLERARQARAEAMAAGARWLVNALIGSLRAVARFVHYAGYGIAKRPPEVTYATTAPGRLTHGCG
jgi:NAD-dependent oxidoreductase involved in siderophore biosynthesis